MKFSNSLYKFILIGVFNTAINYLLYLLLLQCGLHYNLALIIDYAFGIAIGFYLHKNYTFTQKTRKKGLFIRYLGTYGLVFTLNAVLLNLLVLSGLFGPDIGQLIALSIATIISFLVQKSWVFKEK